MSRGQAIRPSQFVLTYGVGSILETTNGPRMILDFKEWGRVFSLPDTSLLLSNKYEIRDANVSALLSQGRIFSLPTNADEQIPDERFLFRTGRFPRWALCQDHRILYKLTANGTTRCPECRRNKEAQHEAIRFVRACPRGHLDDVDWKGIVHRNYKNCDGGLFDWVESGSTLKDIILRCRDCGSTAVLQDIYNIKYKCSGRFPESGIQELCQEQSWVILRNASNLRVAETVSALTIPPRTTILHRLLENPRILPILAAETSWKKDKLLSRLKTASRTIADINSILISEIEDATEEELLAAIEDLTEPPKENVTFAEVKQQEFKALRNAAAYGAPPRPSAHPHDFEVDKTAVIEAELTSNVSLRITPVKRLRVVTAQKGYKRPVGGPTPTVVETFYRDGLDRWYVGVELYGEGIFIDLPINHKLQIKESEISKLWLTESKNRGSIFFDPVFVWWHTLSHKLIKALSIDSGYSAASIRERVYIALDDESKSLEGGILLYTAQQGGDGSLGGLIALVPEFSRVLSAALRNLNSCSNDPLCSEQRISADRFNGGACYACLLISETSCEFGNLYLDRNVLRENI